MKKKVDSDKLVWRICIVLCAIIIMALTIYLANKNMPVYKQDDAESIYVKGKIEKVYNR